MTILMLIPDFGRGGAERVFGQLSGELAKNHRVIDCVFNRFEHCEYVSGNEIVDLNVPGGKNWLQKACYFVLRVHRLRRIKKKYGVQLSISHLEGADYINILSRIHDKIVLCVHGTKVRDKNIKGVLGWLRLRIFIPVLYSKASHIVSVSRAIKHELVNHLGFVSQNVTVINNFFDLDTIRMMAEETLPGDAYSLMRNYDVIITSGRLVPEKHQRLLIRLMPFLLKSRPTVKLVVLGSGIMQSTLVREAEEAGLRVQTGNQPFDAKNQVFFPGFCKNPFAYMRNARIFILPSLWEGFPLVLCEALICKVPVIAHDCRTGPREIIAPRLADDAKLNNVLYTEYGILIPFSEGIDEHVLDLWGTVILKLLGDASARNEFILNGEQRAFAFSREKILKEWTSLIAKL